MTPIGLWRVSDERVKFSASTVLLAPFPGESYDQARCGRGPSDSRCSARPPIACQISVHFVRLAACLSLGKRVHQAQETRSLRATGIGARTHTALAELSPDHADDQSKKSERWPRIPHGDGSGTDRKARPESDFSIRTAVPSDFAMAGLFGGRRLRFLRARKGHGDDRSGPNSWPDPDRAGVSFTDLFDE